MPQSPLSAMEKAMRLLSLRALSSAELRTRLLRAGFSPAEADDAVEECKHRHYLDDTQLAADCVELLRSRNTAKRLICRKLQQRGLSAEIADGLPEEDPDAAEIAAGRRALAQKWRLLSRESDPRKQREKAFRFMAGRGFAPSLIFQLLNERGSEDNEEIF